MFATSSFQTPVHISKKDTVRLDLSTGGVTNFAEINAMPVGFGATFNAGKGFEVGFDVSSTFLPPYEDSDLFEDLGEFTNDLSLGLLGRYFGQVTKMFYLGFQLGLNYTHIIYLPDENLGKFNVSAGIPFDFTFGKMASLYFMPEFNVMLGKDGTGVESTFGGTFRVGTLISLGTQMAQMKLEFKPGIMDFANIKTTYNAEFGLGFVFNL